jgi:hypothetical protein
MRSKMGGESDSFDEEEDNLDDFIDDVIGE